MSTNFRNLIELWNYQQLIAEAEQSIHDLLDKHGMILFFTKGSEIFGSPEESRITFAKLKGNDEDVPHGFKDEAKFLAFNLLNAMSGSDSIQNLFGFQDMPQIKVCDRDEVVKKLMAPSKKKAKK